MPVELYQLSLLPQAQDEAQPRPEQAWGRMTYVINDLLLAVSKCGRCPQQQPGVEQRQGRRQPLQAVGVAYPGQLRAKAAPIIFKVFEHLFDPKPLFVTATGPLTGRFRSHSMPGLGGCGRPVHG